MFLAQRLLSGLLLLAFSITISACGSQSPTQPTPDTSDGASVPTAPAITGTPYIAEIPEPGPDTGVVHGVLLNAENQEPITFNNAAADIYLAKIVYTTGEQRPFSLLDQQNSPHTTPDSRGVFVFDNVEPGEYAISVVTPLSQVVVRSADNIEEDLVFTIEAGETLDVGEVYARYP